MEIKSVKSVNNISRLPSVKEHEPGFIKGETVIAKVLSVNGENVVLQSADDVVFSAKVLAQMQMDSGDTLELMVSGKEGSKYLMQALSVNPDMVEINQTPEAVQETGSLHPHIEALLKTLNVEPSEKAIAQIVSALKQTPNLDIKTAVFMITNNIDPTSENVQILQQFQAQGGASSDVLTEMAAQIILTENMPEAELQSALQYLKEYIQGDRLVPESTATGPNNKAQEPGSPGIETGNGFYTVRPSFKNAAILTNSAESIETEAQQNIQNTTIEQTNLAQTISPEQENAAQSAAQALNKARELLSNIGSESQVQINESSAGLVALSQNREAMKIMTKIFEIFSGIDNLKSKTTDVKQENVVKEAKLFALKEALESSDIKNRQVLENQTDRLISQNKMASDINRFAYFHLPINFNNMQKTADIYIYRRKKGSSAKEQEQISILIGLDTESLGRFEVLVRAKGKNVSVKMSRDSERANEVIELRLKSLKESFSDIGYSLNEFSIEKLAQRTTPVLAEEVLAAEDVLSEHRIDYTV